MRCWAKTKRCLATAKTCALEPEKRQPLPSLSSQVWFLNIYGSRDKLFESTFLKWNRRSRSSHRLGLFHVPGLSLAIFQSGEDIPVASGSHHLSAVRRVYTLAVAAGQPCPDANMQEHGALGQRVRRPSVLSEGIIQFPLSASTNHELPGRPRPHNAHKRWEEAKSPHSQWFVEHNHDFSIFLLTLQWKYISSIWQRGSLRVLLSPALMLKCYWL